MDREGEVIKEKLLREDNIKELTREKLKNFFNKVYEVVSSNPIIRQMFFEEEVDILVRKIPPERMKEYNKRLMRDLLPIIKRWQDEGAIINDYRPEVIVALLQVLYHPILHKKDFDENVFDEMLKLLVDIIAKGLVVE